MAAMWSLREDYIRRMVQRTSDKVGGRYEAGYWTEDFWDAGLPHDIKWLTLKEFAEITIKDISRGDDGEKSTYYSIVILV